MKKTEKSLVDVHKQNSPADAESIKVNIEGKDLLDTETVKRITTYYKESSEICK